ncbi:MAG: hypothetical protein FJ044_03530 [Candidatus Cloacimonetes bacterium]|nr:hypothetical protein [Candidatus Cloacimonadota bacterium]
MAGKLFAAAIKAEMIVSFVGRPPQIKVSIMPVVFPAESHYEAQKVALERAREEWPAKLGWFNHDAAMLEIPEEPIRSVV